MTYRHALNLDSRSRVRRKVDGAIGKVNQFWDGTDARGRKLIWMLVLMPDKQYVQLNHRDVELLSE